MTLTTLAAGRFNDNSFLLLPGKKVRICVAGAWQKNAASQTDGLMPFPFLKVVTFLPFGELNLPTLTSSLRVEHLQMHQ